MVYEPAGLSWTRWTIPLLSALGRLPEPPMKWLVQEKDHECAHTVLAMLTGLSVQQVRRIAGTDRALTVSETINMLDRLGIRTRALAASFAEQFWNVYERQWGGSRRLQGLLFRAPQGQDKYGHVLYLFGPWLYDTADGSFHRFSPSTLKNMDWVALVPPTKQRAA